MKILNKRPDLKWLAIKHYEQRQIIKTKLVEGLKCGVALIGLTVLGLGLFIGAFAGLKLLDDSTKTVDNRLAHDYSEMYKIEQREIYLNDITFNNDEQSQKLFKLLKQYQDKPSKQLANKIKHDIDFNKAGFKVKNYDYSDKTSIANFTQIGQIKFSDVSTPRLIISYTQQLRGKESAVLDSKAMLILPK